MLGIVEGAFTARTAAEPTTPVVVSVPHAGVRTAGFEETLTPELDVRCDADLFVDRLYRIGEPEGPETYVAAQLSRFVCDLNRDPDDVAPGAVPEHPRPAQRRRARLHLGGHHHGRARRWRGRSRCASGAAAPRSTPPTTRRSRRALGPGARPVRVRHPRRRPLDAVARPPGPHRHRPRARRRRPRRSRGDELLPRAARAGRAPLRGGGPHACAPNEPYKGGFITAHHGRPADNIHAIQIELRRDLYMDEEAFDRRRARLRSPARASSPRSSPSSARFRP